MRLWSVVMVASTSSRFTDSVAKALHDEGAVVICVETVEGALQAVEDGFRPGALVVDGMLPFAPALIACLRRHPDLEDMQVIAASPVRAGTAFLSGGVTVIKRHDLAAVVDALDAQQRLL
jgi:CheY-like chemotaxis protein